MPSYIHGSSDPRETARLEKQARFAAPFILEGFDVPPGQRVLDLATGVGAMAGQILSRWPRARVVGLDLDPRQLSAARRNHHGPAWLRGDATRLPFRDGSFDRVHASWFLEHVTSPPAILREARRVLVPGGYCHFAEVDNASFRVRPELPRVMEAMETQNRAQIAAGGDPYVGRRLGTLLEEAGFARVEVRPFELRASVADPVFFRGAVEEFAEIFEGLDEALDPAVASRLRAAAQELRGLPAVPGARLDYRGYLGEGWR